MSVVSTIEPTNIEAGPADTNSTLVRSGGLGHA
jgi:hypothetical protein